MTKCFPLIKSVVIPLAKSVFVPLGITTAASARDAGIKKKNFGSGLTTLIFLNGELNDIIKVIKSLEDAGLLIKGVAETVENEKKNNLRIFRHFDSYIRC